MARTKLGPAIGWLLRAKLSRDAAEAGAQIVYLLTAGGRAAGRAPEKDTIQVAIDTANRSNFGVPRQHQWHRFEFVI